MFTSVYEHLDGTPYSSRRLPAYWAAKIMAVTGSMFTDPDHRLHLTAMVGGVRLQSVPFDSVDGILAASSSNTLDAVPSGVSQRFTRTKVRTRDVRLLVSLVSDLVTHAEQVRVHVWGGTLWLRPGALNQEQLARMFLPAEIVARETAENGGWNGRTTGRISPGDDIHEVIRQMIAVRPSDGVGLQAAFSEDILLLNQDSTFESVLDAYRRRDSDRSAGIAPLLT